MFIAALFIIARTWKQPGCPSADEWIRSYGTYTQVYVLLSITQPLKRIHLNQFLMRWMKLELIIQSEVSQKEQHQYSISSVQFSRSVLSNSLQPHELQHTRPPCPSPTPGVHSESCPSSPWCHPAISSSVIPFSSCTQSLPASEFFQWVNSSHEVAKVLEF